MSKKKSQTTNNRGVWQVTLHDDSINTFDHVIDCLIDICGHNQFQAHQCALITHNRKRCVVYKDKWERCEFIRKLLKDEGLTVTVEKYEKDV
jgi:ATP-dependent Clp protease adaptor protein ClpS